MKTGCWLLLAAAMVMSNYARGMFYHRLRGSGTLL